MIKAILVLVNLSVALCNVALASPVGPSIVKKGPSGSTALDNSILGVVEPTYRCGGFGTPLQLRISDCVGVCSFIPGQVYQCEKDFMPSSAASSLTLRVEICLNTGFCMQIINAVLANSSVQPGFIYTASYNLVCNDVLSGQSVQFRASILQTDSQLVEICVSADVTIQEPVGR